MRNLVLYKDMHEGTENHNVYSKKVQKYIDEVKDKVPPDMMSILNSFKMNLGEFSMRFYKFDTNEFMKEKFENYIDKFCVIIETIQILTSAEEEA